MRAVASFFVVQVMLLSSAAATEPVIFHTARFGDDTVVNLSLVGSQLAAKMGYDYDVIISLSQMHSKSGDVYRDPGKHRALVKCADPAKVSVRGVDYPIPAPENGSSDWKDDLWKAVCTPPVS
jgi:hypothetical protein